MQILLASEVHLGDDAYLTFRTIRLLLEGHGFVGNIGERVISTTTPFYALTLAALCTLTNTYPHEIYFPFGVTFHLLDIALIYICVFLATGNRLTSSLAASVFSLSAYVNYSVAVGMETPFFLFFVLLSVVATMYKQDQNGFSKLAAISAGLATITRPEGAFVALGLAIYQWKKNKKIPFRTIFTSAIPILPIAVGALLYYGTVIPQSVIAKSICFPLPPLTFIKVILQLAIAPLFPAAMNLGKITFIGFLLSILIVIPTYFLLFKRSKNIESINVLSYFCLFSL